MTYKLTSKRDDYLTPSSFYEKVLNNAGIGIFDCDVCCTVFNIPALYHYKKDGLYSFDEKVNDKDGLSGDWYQYNWCNPPFRIANKFVYKAIEEQKKGCTTYMLIPVRTEMEYWRKGILLDGRACREDIDIIFLKKGLCFLDPDTGKPVQMKQTQKDGSIKYVDGVHKEGLALVIFKGHNTDTSVVAKNDKEF